MPGMAMPGMAMGGGGGVSEGAASWIYIVGVSAAKLGDRPMKVGGNVVVTGTVQATDLLMPGGRTFMNHRHDDILIGVPGNPPLPGF